MVNAILYLASSGCQWRMLPKDFPPLQRYFYAWHDNATTGCGKGSDGLTGQVHHLFADGAYSGDKLATALAGLGQWTLEIVKRSDATQGFVVLPRRWVVERTLAWLGRCRRLAKDWERSIESSTARTLIAHIRRLTRLIARHCYL